MSKLKKDDQTQFVEMLAAWRDDPNLFAKEALGATPEKWQADALRLLKDNDRISIRSGHGVGKSTLLAWIIWWFEVTRFPALVACTAPTSTQLSDVLWGALIKWHKRLPEAIGGMFEVKADRIELRESRTESFVAARTARKEQPEAFQGYHAENMLFVVDEASGVDDIIFQVGEGSMSTAGAKTLLVGNPTRVSGYFYETFHKMRGTWATMKVGCEDSTQVSKQYIEQMAQRYGRDSNVFRIRVLGEFPTTEDDAVIPLFLCESAVDRDVDVVEGSVVWGLDVARFGDDRTALAKRQANHLLEPIRSWKGLDLMQTCGRVASEYAEAKKKPSMIFVDAIGMGAGVVDRLKEIGLPVTGINVAECPSVADKYMRSRDELWFKCREWLEGLDVKMPKDDQLIAELTAVKYGYTSSGKIKVEGKAEMKKRGAISPDLADAFNLTFAYQGQRRNVTLNYQRIGVV